jgi:ribonuclease HII
MNFNLEKKLSKQGYRMIIGVDEAGRGPLAGPVVACATTVRNDKFLISNDKSNPNEKISNDKKWNLIRDSKKLSAKQRETLFDFIHENFYVGVGMRDHKTVDRINILQATYLAMKASLADLNVKIKNKKLKLQCKNKNYFGKKCIILVDGNNPIPDLKVEQRAIVKGDEKIFSISAASIIAKVTRDRWMIKMHQKYPDYDFARHKGYGTKLHLEQLKKLGPSPIHRQSFRPVRECVYLPKPVFDVKFRKVK